MYYTKEQPTTGSFVKVWVGKDGVFSRDYKYIDGVLHVYDGLRDDWFQVGPNQILSPSIRDIMYITSEVPFYTEMV